MAPGFPIIRVDGRPKGPHSQTVSVLWESQVQTGGSSPTWAGVPPYGTHLDFVRDPERTGLFQYKYLDLPRPRNLCNAAARHSGADEAHKMD